MDKRYYYAIWSFEEEEYVKKSRDMDREDCEVEALITHALTEVIYPGMQEIHIFSKEYQHAYAYLEEIIRDDRIIVIG